MPIFHLNKLIRDKLVAQFEHDNQVATYRQLSDEEHLGALRDKVYEEAAELPSESNPEEALSELADVYQALVDYALLQGLSEEAVLAERARKFEKKGGFAGGNFVTDLELAEDDPWTNYFREHPDYEEKGEE